VDLSIVVLICFVAISAVCGAVFLVLRDVFAPRSSPPTETFGSSASGKSLRRIPNVFDEVPATSFTGRLDQAFDWLVLETGYDMTPTAAFLMLLACGILVGGSAFVYYDNPFPGIAGMTLGMVLPLLFLMFHRSRRMHEMHEQFPNVVDMFARAVRAGHSLEQAIDFVGTETRGSLGVEFSRCARQLEMGLSVSGMAQALARRVRLIEFRMLAATLMVHRQTGGNLPQALERMASVVRDRLNYYRQMRASTAAGRSSTILMAIISPLLYIIMFVWQPEHVKILLDNPAGQTMLMVAIGMEAVGLIWVASLLRSDY